MQNKINMGKAMKYTPVVDIKGGELVTVGQIVGVALGDILPNEEGLLETEGLFEFPASVATALEQGTIVYASTAGKITPTAGALTRAGIVWEKREAGDGLVRVKINV